MTDKKLAFGLMRLPLKDASDVTSIDYEVLCGMADSFINAGFTYFDTAAPYHAKTSETAFRECVARRYPREAFTVTDKLTLSMIDTADDIPGFFDAQLARCGVDYFDYYLLHALNRDSYQKAKNFGAFAFAAEKKAEGKVRHIGFSFHDNAALLDEILTNHPEVEYVQLQINYLDWEDPDIQSKDCYEVCVKHKKPVLVMEPVKGGLLAGLPGDAAMLLKEAAPGMSAASWAIRYAASLENVCMVLSGMSTPEQVKDNLSYMTDFTPLSDSEMKVLAQAAEIIRSKETIPCTACRYCVESCPKKIAIPEYFKLCNNISKFGDTYSGNAKRTYDHHVSQGHGKASECIGCRQCESHCPQHLPVTAYLKDAVRLLEV